MKAQTQIKHKPFNIMHLVCLLVCFALFLFFLQSSIFSGGEKLDLSNKVEVDILSQFQTSVQQCVVSFYKAKRGLGLSADIIDHCKLKLLSFPKAQIAHGLMSSSRRGNL